MVEDVMSGDILIVDDERDIRQLISLTLEDEGFTTAEAANAAEARASLVTKPPSCLVLDIWMRDSDMDGLELLSWCRSLYPDLPVVMISGHGTIETAVDATKKGAYDFLPKPPDLNRLLVSVRNAIDKSDLVVETKTLKKKISKSMDMVGESPAIAEVKEMIEKVAPTDARVLINGPNGSGKELVARWIYQKSNRDKAPFVEVNCAAIPAELIESELFGHEKGAFTSAIKQRIGKFEQASGGTLFLDEIGDMSHSAQAKVLRALQEHKITRVGGDKDIKVDVRVIAATNKDLKQEIADGNFREDLYHRLSGIVIKVPALNDRKDDIPALVEKFLGDIAKDYGTAAKEIEPKALDYLKTLDWTGNIRQLRNVVERLIIMSEKKITEKDAKTYAP